MRPKYYIRLFGQMNARKPFVLFVIAIILILISSIYLLNSITPAIKIACQSRAKAIGVQITEETVNEFIKNVEYETLMHMTYNEQGKIIAINANIIELNKLSSEISYKIQEKLNNLDKVPVEIPITSMLGINVFSGYGPDISIKLVPMGNIETNFDTSFASQGINQTKHTIYMNITSNITVVAPFIGSSVECNSTVTIAETIIVGDIPDTYYNIEGLDEAAESGIIDTM
ncbi:MAG: sporulation protein YunB [Clostridia bacterium]|nr:sporulation protein YunB [Clostridia bacterium]